MSNQSCRLHRFTGALFCAASAVSLFAPSAIAQEEQTQGGEAIVLDTVEVKGFRGSFANSLDLKRNADQVVDAITAEELGQFPDQNVSEAIQRIAGVQITRNNGEGEAVNIRGLSANFTRVEVDGRSASVTIDSADNSVKGSNDVAVELRFSASMGMFSIARWSAMKKASNFAASRRWANFTIAGKLKLASGVPPG